MQLALAICILREIWPDGPRRFRPQTIKQFGATTQLRDQISEK